MRSRFVAAATAISMMTGCSFMQPTASGAPIADVVGAGIMAGGTTVAVVAMDRTNTGAPDFGASGGYTAGTCTLAGLTVVYVLSAIYGFTRDPKTQQSEPILGLQILAAGLAGFGKGVNSGNSNGNEHQGCCSYHGGVDHCEGERLICADGERSPTCKCE